MAKNERNAQKGQGKPPSMGSASGPMRLNKYIARAGITSRRKADDLIAEGRVRVNGEVVTEMGVKVTEQDEVSVGGRVIAPRNRLYVLLNKPAGAVTTTDDPQGRQTVMDLLDLDGERAAGMFPVGRLDLDTEGVLLITNDGALAHRLMHPSYEIEKLYRVETKQPIKAHEIDLLRRGVELEDGTAAADQVAYVEPGNRRVIGMSLHEGRNRQIRRMLESLDHFVHRLERVNYAGLTTKGLERGRWRYLKEHEVEQLRRKVRMS